jgi:malonyl-CoA O-methyltransferase
MLRRAMQSKRAMLAVNSDIDFLPIRPGVLHGATTVSVLQWLPSPQGALRNIAQTLKPGGVFYFSIFVDGSFTELIEAKSRMGLSQAIWLPTADELPAIFNKAGFNIDASICGIEHFKKTLTFPNALSALKSLSDIGATAISGQPLGRRGLDELCGNYTSMFSENGSDVLLTYHAVIGRACLKSK